MRLKKVTTKDVKEMYGLLATCLIPEPESVDEYRKLKHCQIVDVKVKEQKRNYEHHKKFFAILNYVVDNSEFTGNEDDLLTVLKYEIGYTNTIIDFKGNEKTTPKSINFEVLGQKSFEEFYNACMFVLSNYIGDSIENIENNSLEYKTVKNC